MIFILYFVLQLLASEIRHERNVLLQCVRYIVKNDFFGRRKTIDEAVPDPPDGDPVDIVDDEIWENVL